MNVLLTGSTGFIGKRVLDVLSLNSMVKLTAVARRNLKHKNVRFEKVEPYDSNTNWMEVLSGQDVIIHAAAIAHVSNVNKKYSDLDYHLINFEATINLARQAVIAGVSRFIFISSIGVNGNYTERPFSEEDVPKPVDPYALSKWEAEKGLWDIQSNSDMELVIIRPPLVYGPNAPGKFSSLVHLVNKGIPLPLGAINNKRTFISLDNLVDLIITCVFHNSASNQLFLAGDSQDLSTTELIQCMSRVLNKPLHLFSVPKFCLKFGATLLGKESTASSLLNSLQVDISKAQHLLGWEPPLTVDEGLRLCFKKDKSDDSYV